MPEEREKKFGIFIQLDDNEQARFLNYKERSNIKSRAEAARKLMLDQLDQIEAPISDRAKSETRGARELAA